MEYKTNVFILTTTRRAASSLCRKRVQHFVGIRRRDRIH